MKQRKKKHQGESHLNAWVDEDLYQRLLVHLTNKNKTVTDWVKEKMKKELS